MSTTPVSPKKLTSKQRLMLVEWLKLCKDLDILKKREMGARKKIIAQLFGALKEGLQTMLFDDFLVAAKGKVSIRIDEAALNAVMEQMDEPYRILGVLINYKPALVMSGYKALSDENRKVFEQALIVKPAAPELHITRRAK